MSNYILNNTASDIDTALGKVLSPDTSPQANDNLVTSGGVKTYVDGEVSTLDTRIDNLASTSVTRKQIATPSLSACTQLYGVKYVYAGVVESPVYSSHNVGAPGQANGSTTLSINNSINVGVPYDTIVGATVRVTIEQVTNTGGGFKGVTFLTADGEIMQHNMMPFSLPTVGSTSTTTVGSVYVPIPKGMGSMTVWADYFYGRGLNRVTIRAGLTHLYVS